MLRIDHNLKSDFKCRKPTRKNYCNALLILAIQAAMVSGCGGDNDTDSAIVITSSPANTLSITSSNTEQIVNTVFSKSSLYFDVMERLFTALPDDTCPFGGSASIDVDDEGVPGEGEAGDSVRRQYADCVYSDPIFMGSFNGVVMIDITQASGDIVLDSKGDIYLGMTVDSSADFEVSIDNFTDSELDLTTDETVSTILGVQGSATRDLEFNQRDFERNDRSKGQRFTVSQGDEGAEFDNFDMLCQRSEAKGQVMFSIDTSLSTFTVSDDSNSENSINSTSGASVILGSSSQTANETVKIETNTPFEALFNSAPDAGQMTIQGAQRSSLVLTALGSDSVSLQLDSNGDGDFSDPGDSTVNTTWTDIGIDFQGFCLN